ncbi:unnamed protein product, partial [Pylaiella littoralis]
MAAAEALRLGMLISFFCRHFLSDTKCDLKPSRIQRYLGILCDSSTTSFRIPEDKLSKLREIIREVLARGSLSGKTLETIAGKCVSMSVAIRPASLWTHYMFAAIAKAKGKVIQLHDHADLRAELAKWFTLSSTAQEGPWYKVRHFATEVTLAASDA